MTTTPNLALTYIAPSQAQKEVTHNAALNDLDFLAKAAVIDHTLNTPPSVPNTGDSYIIGTAPTGAWTGSANQIAGYYGGWTFKTPLPGWTVWTRNDNRLMYFNGSAWALLTTPKLDAISTWTPGTIANAGSTSLTGIGVTGAALGDFVMVAAPYDLQGLSASAYVSAANTIAIRLTNATGASVTLASGSWCVRVVKA